MCVRITERYSICRCLYYRHSIDPCRAYGQRGHRVQERTVLVGYACGRHGDTVRSGNHRDTVRSGNRRDTVRSGNHRSTVRSGNRKDTVRSGNQGSPSAVNQESPSVNQGSATNEDYSQPTLTRSESSSLLNSTQTSPTLDSTMTSMTATIFRYPYIGSF